MPTPKNIYVTSIFPTRHGWYAIGRTSPTKSFIFQLCVKGKMHEYPVWITLDLSNGENWEPGKTKNYLWVDRSEAAARRRYLKHKKNRLATLSKPVMYEACYWNSD